MNDHPHRDVGVLGLVGPDVPLHVLRVALLLGGRSPRQLGDVPGLVKPHRGDVPAVVEFERHGDLVKELEAPFPFLVRFLEFEHELIGDVDRQAAVLHSDDELRVPVGPIVGRVAAQIPRVSLAS